MTNITQSNNRILTNLARRRGCNLYPFSYLLINDHSGFSLQIWCRSSQSRMIPAGPVAQRTRTLSPAIAFCSCYDELIRIKSHLCAQISKSVLSKTNLAEKHPLEGGCKLFPTNYIILLPHASLQAGSKLFPDDLHNQA
jgi:hypothetical protein